MQEMGSQQEDAMTNSEMFIEAHRMAREDVAFVASNYPASSQRGHAYYFRLQLISLQKERYEARNPTALVRGFQIVEPKRLWA
jgi:hypothetical protein